MKFENPVTLARIIIKNELIEIVTLIKKIKRINYETIKIIAEYTDSDDFYYDEVYRTVTFRNEKGQLVDLTEELKCNLEEFSKVVEYCKNQEIIEKFKQMKSLSKTYVETLEGEACIAIRPYMKGSDIVNIVSESDIYYNFYEVWKQIRKYKQELHHILLHNKKIKEDIEKLITKK